MARPSRLTPEQWLEIDRRLAAGQGVRALAREYDVSPATISARRVSEQTERVQSVAKQVAAAQTALAALPVAQQYTAMTLAESFRGITIDLTGAAGHGASNAHRLQALASAEVAKLDATTPEANVETLKGVVALTRAANEAATPAFALMAANKPAVERATQEQPRRASLDVSKLSDQALLELLAARV
jgi:anti-sigma-K factor RskA